MANCAAGASSDLVRRFDGGNPFEAPLAEGGIIEEAVRAAAAVSKDSSTDGAAPRFVQVGPGCELFAAPLLVGGEVVAALYADQHTAGKDARPARFAWRPALEMIARHAARCLEAITAIRTAQLLTGTASPRADIAGSVLMGDDELGGPAVRETARVGDQALSRGRRRRGAPRTRPRTRLGGEIARARTLYEQRVPAQLRAAADFFHEELVRTLAEGDERLLKSAV